VLEFVRIVAVKLVKPPAVEPGDTVGVVASAAAVERSHLERGIEVLAGLGFRVKVSPRVLARDGIFAGTDQERAGELAAFFADSEVKAIFGARGGYGTGRLLPLLDFAGIARTPKAFIGFSDATFLLNALVARSSMLSFHGPMVAMDFARGLSARSLEHLCALLGGTAEEFALDAREIIRPGLAHGELIGGCLSVVAAMLATPYVPSFDGRILFLEDTGEKAYRIDRMLVQLEQAGIFERVAGIVFGAFRPPDASEFEARLTAAFVAERTARLRCPVLFGIEAGHGTENFTLPIGARAVVDGRAGRLIIAEAAVARSS
jgi:muramoyltetrapeptide carboxypeptidase